MLRRRAKVDKRESDRALRDGAGIRKLRENPIFQTPRQQAKLAAWARRGGSHAGAGCSQG